jgi:hypothetical protein
MVAEPDRIDSVRIIKQADALTEEVKALALHLAVYVAKAKADSSQVSRLEPEFMKLVNGTVKVVQELAILIRTAGNAESSAFSPSTDSPESSDLESRLRTILDQCRSILTSLEKHDSVDLKG